MIFRYFDLDTSGRNQCKALPGVGLVAQPCPSRFSPSLPLASLPLASPPLIKERKKRKKARALPVSEVELAHIFTRKFLPARQLCSYRDQGRWKQPPCTARYVAFCDGIRTAMRGIPVLIFTTLLASHQL